MATTPAALHIPELVGEPGLVHGFSTVAIGSVGLKHAPDSAPVMAARRTFAGVLGLDGAELTTIGSVHGASVARVDEPGGSVDDVDALLTDRPGVALLSNPLKKLRELWARAKNERASPRQIRDARLLRRLIGLSR